MLVFIIPLRSKQVAKSWETVSSLLERTLQSVHNQTSSEFRVVVVCHERPTLKNSYSHLEYVEVDFPPPSTTTREAKHIDQCRKIWTGFRHTCQDPNTFFMPLDSDDCVSNRLAQFVQENSDCNGWFFNTGYQYREGSKRIRLRENGFHLICGTSHIIKSEVLHPLIIQKQLSEIEDIRFLQHHHLHKLLTAQGIKLRPLPFPGAVYVTDNQENNMYQTSLFLKEIGSNPKELARFYALRLYRVFLHKGLTPQVCNEFNLYSI